MATDKFCIGDVVRYGDGPTALMVITQVHENYGGGSEARYYGRQFFGSSVGYYHMDCSEISIADRERIADRIAGRAPVFGSQLLQWYQEMQKAIVDMDARRAGK